MTSGAEKAYPAKNCSVNTSHVLHANAHLLYLGDPGNLAQSSKKAAQVIFAPHASRLNQKSKPLGTKSAPSPFCATAISQAATAKLFKSITGALSTMPQAPNLAGLISVLTSRCTCLVWLDQKSKIKSQTAVFTGVKASAATSSTSSSSDEGMIRC